MFRPLTVVSIAAFCLVGWHVYQAEEGASLLERELRDVLRKTEAARERSQVLRAEWALLNEPERLRQVAQKHLALEAMTPAQFLRLPDLQKRLPNAVAFAGPVSLFGSAPETALAAAQPKTAPAAARPTEPPALLAGAQAAAAGAVAAAALAASPPASRAATPAPAAAPAVAAAVQPAPAVQTAAAPSPRPAAPAPRPAVIAKAEPRSDAARPLAPPSIPARAPLAAPVPAIAPATAPIALAARGETPRSEAPRAETPARSDTGRSDTARAEPPRRRIAPPAERAPAERNPLLADGRAAPRVETPLLRTASHTPAPQPVAAPPPTMGGSSLGYQPGSRLAPPVPLARPVPLGAGGWGQ